jgi:hypothetical protein
MDSGTDKGELNALKDTIAALEEEKAALWAQNESLVLDHARHTAQLAIQIEAEVAAKLVQEELRVSLELQNAAQASELASVRQELAASSVARQQTENDLQRLQVASKLTDSLKASLLEKDALISQLKREKDDAVRASTAMDVHVLQMDKAASAAQLVASQEETQLALANSWQVECVGYALQLNTSMQRETTLQRALLIRDARIKSLLDRQASKPAAGGESEVWDVPPAYAAEHADLQAQVWELRSELKTRTARVAELEQQGPQPMMTATCSRCNPRSKTGCRYTSISNSNRL